jgi:hypothetical protein
MALVGFPVINFAASLRNINASAGTGARVAMAIPRSKYTFLIQMQINSNALTSNSAQTNVSQYVQNGQIYGQLKSIEYPKPKFEVDTLRSYNRYKKVYKKVSYDAASMVWHDDSTSMVTGLIKEYMNFYHETGNIGTEGSSGTVFDDSQMSTEAGVFSIGSGVRTNMSSRPSLGLKLRPESMRHFFDYITIYDLGTEPNSVNTYTFHRPVITSFGHDPLDYYANDLVSTPWLFEYEGYYNTVGQSVEVFNDVLDLVLGGDSNS